MKAGAGLYTSQQQTQILAPQMIQSVQVLQCGYDELRSYILDQVERNPVLDLATPKLQSSQNTYAPFMRKGTLSGSGDLRAIEETHSASVSLYDYLHQQVMASFKEPRDQAIATKIVYALEPDGYLRQLADEIIEQCQITSEDFERILSRIQNFEPSGVGARDLTECLKIQLLAKNRLSQPMMVLLKNLPLLAGNHLPKLAKLCGVSPDEIMGMMREIRALVPKPGDCFESEPSIRVVADVLISVDEAHNIKIELNPQALPRVLVDRAYASKISVAKLGNDEKQFIIDCLQSAHWLVKSLDQRAQTILKVATYIASYQRAFLIAENGHLRPLTMRQVAEALDMHESTISRTVSHKYIMTNRGLFEMKYFFSKAIAGVTGEEDLSAKTIQQKIKQLIDGESANGILSDDSIAAKLQAEGIEIARRTVAKYRDLMKIGSSAERRWQKRQMG
ncbi:RNA polymerase sigma-54 factor [Paenochrobactrum gallinarii]|uniref:RNA polymerase sigma-54 factor n=1 Tax=Paenochrobactrum gallinarii TaxID=643673 RepID=A0A841LX59_9HYPH|nr:RNA polymerase factor sigma-54 [Paenochrobactrum gallinarii]MBB6261926.1 RNA polymerase sigma-54 factor [Paenochrobactrum gallinarii]